MFKRLKYFLVIFSICFSSSNVYASIAESMLYSGSDLQAVPGKYAVSEFKNNLFLYDTENKLILRGYSFSNKTIQKSKIVLFFGGNAFNYYSGDKVQFLFNKYFKEKTIALYTLQYPGYSGSKIEMHEKHFISAGIKAYKTLRKTFPNAQITIWGHSLGAGVAAKVAAALKDAYSLVILTSAWSRFYEICSEQAGFLSFLCPEDIYNTTRFLGKISSPVLLIHGKLDKIIPLTHFYKNKAVLHKNQKAIFSKVYSESNHHNVIKNALLKLGKTIINAK